MTRTPKFAIVLLAVVLVAGLGTVLAKSPTLYDQIGGKPTVTALATEFLGSAAKDPQLQALMGGKNVEAITPKFADALCAALRGGCPQPYTKEELRSAATKVNPTQGDAIRANWKAAMDKVGIKPELQEAITKALGDKLRAVFAVLH